MKQAILLLVVFVVVAQSADMVVRRAKPGRSEDFWGQCPGKFCGQARVVADEDNMEITRMGDIVDCLTHNTTVGNDDLMPINYKLTVVGLGIGRCRELRRDGDGVSGQRRRTKWRVPFVDLPANIKAGIAEDGTAIMNWNVLCALMEQKDTLANACN